MTPAAHYAEAERFLDTLAEVIRPLEAKTKAGKLTKADVDVMDSGTALLLRLAQAHATLAQTPAAVYEEAAS